MNLTVLVETPVLFFSFSCQKSYLFTGLCSKLQLSSYQGEQQSLFPCCHTKLSVSNPPHASVHCPDSPA